MTSLRVGLFVAAVACLAGAHLDAHHSFAGTYLEDRTVTIEGELVQFVYRNPHSFVVVDVHRKGHPPVRYAVEWTGAGQLRAQGITRETLDPGDRLIISGAPGRNPGDHRIRMASVRRPSDGFGWGHRRGEAAD